MATRIPRTATHGHLRQSNQQLLLRAVYTGLANSRTELAQETGMAKPTVSDLIGELIDQGYLIEKGFGKSTEEGGKRPRLLEFVPDARQVIGISIDPERVTGVLTNLDGQVVVEHFKDLAAAQGKAVIDVVCQVINGLAAQLSAPLLCIGVGVPGMVDTDIDVVRYAPHLGWQDVALSDLLAMKYEVPTHIANSTELAALAQFAFGEMKGAKSLVTILVNDSIGVGSVVDGAIYHSGGEIGQLRIPGSEPFEHFLGWPAIQERYKKLFERYAIPGDQPSYLWIRQGIAASDPEALALQDEIAGYLAQIFAWVIVLLRPEHLSLAGSIAELGQPLLDCVIGKAQELLTPQMINSVQFAVHTATNLVAVGAVAQTLQLELGHL